MRICLVAHGFPPIERTGVENYTAGLAAAFARQDHDVEVFAPRKAPWLPEFSLRRETQDGFGVNWLSVNLPPRGPEEMLESPQVAERFGSFLDRERPEVVHFQHFVKLGLGLVFEARKRGIPTIYTAHDYYPICHRYTLLRPDLGRCDVRGDSMACARCDVALAYLNRMPKLGDYQMGALPEQLEEDQRRVLGEILAGTSTLAGFDQERIDAAFDVRQRLDGRRSEAFRAVDLVVAPTAYLRDELVRGGLDPEHIEVLPYGIENADLRDRPPVRRDPSRPVRFAFFGGLAKHKGVHVLIEAFRRAEVPAELSIWGYSTDRAYVRRMREAATGAKALWRGPYDRRELPALLADVDVVVVPSLWVENYPLVIRESFSAGRPVVAPRLGALPESVRDGVDGRLYEADDADSLAAVLRELAREPQAIERLAAGIEPVKGVDAQARELLDRYARLVRAARLAREEERARRPLPASLAPFVERFLQLSALPNRELFSRAIVRLEKLRAGLGAPVSRLGIEELLLRALGTDSRSQVALRDSKLENAWMHETLESHEEVEQELEARLRWREAHLKSLAEERDWLRKEEESLAKERDWLRENRESLAEERDWLRENRESLAEERDWLLGDRDSLQRERDWLREDRKSLTEERDWLREVLEATEERLRIREGELQSATAERDWLRGIVEGKEKETKWLREVLQARELELEWVRERLAGVLRSHGELEKLSHDLRRSLEEAEAGNRGLREDLLLTGRNLETTKANLERVNTLLEASETNLRKTVRNLQTTEERLAQREADLQRTREDLEGTNKDLETTAESLVTTETNLRRTEDDLETTRKNLDVAQGNLTRIQGQLRNAAELGLVSLKAQERLIGAEILPLIEEIQELDRSTELDEVLSTIPQTRPELLELVRAAQVSRKRVRELSAELEWRRHQMQDAYRAYQRGLANMVLRRTGVGRTVATWDESGEEEAR